MKKFNGLIVITIILYVVFTILLGRMTLSMEENRKHEYRVEGNRILKDLQEGKEVDLKDYSFITEISLLGIKEAKQEQIQEFFTEENEKKSMLYPVFHEGELTSYAKFYYTEEKFPILSILIVFEIGLLAIFVLILLLLFYMKNKIIKPFYRFSNMPEALKKGHYKDEIKVEKSRYFNQFLLGMSQLQDELEGSKKRQLQLLKEKKQLLLSLSHDIKTPLNLIKLYEKSLEENIYENEAEKKKALKQIGQKKVEIEQYMDEITMSFREEITDLPVNVVEFYLGDVLDKVFAIYEEQCQLRHIKFSVDKYENRLTKGDTDRLQEVIENLLENAIKYGDGREIKITFSEEEYCYLIHIDNSGKPVLEQELVHLFDSFFRGTNAIGKQGSGLGLYISKLLMRKMEGDIYAENKENGMRYTIVLR